MGSGKGGDVVLEEPEIPVLGRNLKATTSTRLGVAIQTICNIGAGVQMHWTCRLCCFRHLSALPLGYASALAFIWYRVLYPYVCAVHDLLMDREADVGKG